MANKIKKVSINAIEKIIEDEYSPVTTVEWNGVRIVVKRHLGLRDMLAFVDAVVKNCFQNDNSEYYPELKDFAIKNYVIEYYTNISLPSNVDKRYDLIYRSGVFYTIISYIDQEQFDRILTSIDEKVLNIANSNIEAINRQMNEMIASFNDLQSQFSTIIDGVDGDTVSAALKALSGGIDEEKIVNAVVNSKNKED